MPDLVDQAVEKLAGDAAYEAMIDQYERNGKPDRVVARASVDAYLAALTEAGYVVVKPNGPVLLLPAKKCGTCGGSGRGHHAACLRTWQDHIGECPTSSRGDTSSRPPCPDCGGSGSRPVEARRVDPSDWRWCPALNAPVDASHVCDAGLHRFLYRDTEAVE